MTDNDRYVLIGKVGAAHGVQGWVKVTSYTDAPADIFSYAPWYIQENNQWKEISFADPKQHDKYLVARINNCKDRDAARRLTNLEIGIKKSQLPETAENEHYWSDLENLSVKTVGGVYLGTVDHLFQTGANDVMVVIDKENGNNRRLLPFIREQVVISVDMDNKEITVDWDHEF